MASSSLGDEDTIIKGLSSYFSVLENAIHIYKNGIRAIEIEYPDELNEENVYYITKEIKAAGIRFILTKDLYWEDLTYEQMETMTYEQLEKYRYERGDNKWVNLHHF